MGVSAWISVTFLLISAVIAVPTGDHRKATLNIGQFIFFILLVIKIFVTFIYKDRP